MENLHSKETGVVNTRASLKYWITVVAILMASLQEIGAVPCSQMTCPTSTVCKEVFDKRTGLVSAMCLRNPEMTGNENQCQKGQPLFTTTSMGQPLEASCAPDSGERNVPGCPPDYFCFFNPTVCCPAFTKSTTCPVNRLDGRIGGVCVKACGDDGQCPGDQKCCSTLCGGTFCQSPTPTCGAKTCTPEERCVLLKGSCLVEPCDPVPTCISARGKCPADTFSWDLYSRYCYKQCASDTQCPENQLCCLDYFKCGTQCKTPVPSFTCQNLPCSPNQHCMMQTDLSCTRSPCFDIPACINIDTACNPPCPFGTFCGVASNPYTGQQEFRCKSGGLPMQGHCDEMCQFLLFLAMLKEK